MKPHEWRNELLAVILAVLLAMPETIRTWRRWHRHFNRSLSTDTENVATIDERGVTIAAQGRQQMHPWPGFSRVYDSRRVVVFEKDADHLLFLPKAAMSGAQLGELRRLVLAARNCKVSLAAPTG
jgi:hypothetical protein